jgi:microcystin-dependent protein
LFAVIGTTFGAGDGSTTFNVPNFNNRMPIGAGSLYSAGGTGGSKDAIVVSHTHTATDSGHTHTYNNTQSSGDYDLSPGGNRLLRFFSGLTSGTGTANISVSTTGSSGTNANLPPYLGVYFIIKT